MIPKHRQFRSGSLVSLVLFTSFQLVAASLSLQELQPIANFPSKCDGAYQTPIQNCPDAKDFSLDGSNTGTSVCSKDCFNSISKAVFNIQKACQGTSAPPGTVIAHAFAGDLATLLCSVNNGGGSPSPSNANPESTTPPDQSSASDSASATNTDNSSATSASNTDNASSATDSSNSATSTSDQSSTTTLSTEASSQTATASSQSTSTSSSSRAVPTLNPGGGGSPFDQTVPNIASPADSSASIFSLAISLAFAVILGT